MKRLTLLAVVLAASPALASVPDIVLHPANLNWDLFNTTNHPINDFELIFEQPDWFPPNVYTGVLGFPSYTRSTGDFVPAHPGLETKLRFHGRTFQPNDLLHVGAFLEGAGRLLDAYFTFTDGNGVSRKVGNSVATPWEITRVVRPVSPALPRLEMRFQAPDGFLLDEPGSTLRLENFRSFVDLPASLLDLPDLNPSLNLASLAAYERTAINPIAPVELTLVSSFFDVFLTTDFIPGPEHEALLTADIVRLTSAGQPVPVGRVWSLNYQCPEPAAALSLLATLPLLRRRH
jgi:hypothetical protein